MSDPSEGDPPVSDVLSAESPSSAGDNRWLGEWLLKGHDDPGAATPTAPWWQVMCLTGVDYFSTLGYQPGLAVLTAGVLSPIATAVLVLVTLFVALPVYRQVARYSPHGRGSVSMLEHLLTRWRGKALVLVLLGFTFTAYIITMTLSAADATAHIVENPYVPEFLRDHVVMVTGVLLLCLGAVFLKGLHEAIGVAVVIVGGYLFANVIVLGRALLEVWLNPNLVHGWWQNVTLEHGGLGPAILASLLIFPRIALGLSGFETGVGVMPLVRGDATDTHAHPEGRIRNARKLLLVAALIMSVALIVSSFVAAVLIPMSEHHQGGRAHDRALAFLAHEYLGGGFGTFYDLVTIGILWFAGASAMAGLLNLVPQYLPPYGMAPDWARATRPLVLVFTFISLLVTWAFEASVKAQGDAYGTGVLALMSSAALAVAIQKWRENRSKWLYVTMAVIFGYTTLTVVVKAPLGLGISLLFIGGIVLLSITSRFQRSTELRIGTVTLSPKAIEFLDAMAPGPVRIIAHRPDRQTLDEYARKENQAREDHSLNDGEPIVFLEVKQGDASKFTHDLEVRALRIGPHHILRCVAPAIPNAIAALLLHEQKRTGRSTHAYFGWTDGNPIAYVLKYIFLGEGDTAPVTQEVLRRAVSDPSKRPRIHVG
ncbi:MAG: amino acid transporter [Vicinamibacteria bacterium]